MSQSFFSLPSFIRELVPQPNFSSLNLHNLQSGNNNIKDIINSMKTKTILDLLQPLQINENQVIGNGRPIILVFCQPSQQLAIEKDKIYPYAPVSYSSWLQSSGARCIPLPYNTNQGSIQYLLQRSNGLLIPGGGSNLYKNFYEKQGFGPVMTGFLKIWRYIQKMWNKGLQYPIWGTCLGLEILLIALSGEAKILSSLNSRGHQVQIYSHYQNSTILKRIPINFRLKLQNRKLLNFQHSYGISVQKFLKNKKLAQKLKIVQISKDKNEKWFCSGMEGKNNPIFISQYHPEKQAFQWTKTGEIKHNKDSIQISQFLAMEFVNLCRKHKPIQQFGSIKLQLFYTFHQYKQIHLPQKMYKIYAIDFKYREKDKQIRKQIRNIRCISHVNKNKLK